MSLYPGLIPGENLELGLGHAKKIPLDVPNPQFRELGFGFLMFRSWSKCSIPGMKGRSDLGAMLGEMGESGELLPSVP